MLPFPSPAKDPVVLSYAAFRRVVGYVAFFLPFAVYFGSYLFSGGHPLRPLDSISAYYYTSMGRIFVGSLCAVGTFMFSNRGYDRSDEVAGFFAAFCAFGVANFPTTPCIAEPTPHQMRMGLIHGVAATLLFLTLAFFCLWLFPKGQANSVRSPEKKTRNGIYYASGGVILASLGAIALRWLSQSWCHFFERHGLLFWFEGTCLLAFGFAWMVKGGTFFKDKASIPVRTRTTDSLIGTVSAGGEANTR